MNSLSVGPLATASLHPLGSAPARSPGLVLVIGCLAAGAELAAALEVSAAAGQPDPRGPPSLAVSFRDGRLSIEAKQEPMRKVLSSISRATGIRFHAAIPLDGKITLSVAAQPVNQVLKNLFGPDASFICRYQEVTEAPGLLPLPREVWFLDSVGRIGSEAPRRLRGKDERERIPSASRAVHPDLALENINQTQEPLAGADGTLSEQEAIERLIEMTRDDDPAKRIEGLSGLSEGVRADEASILTALDSALADPDPSVRGYAFLALFNREGPHAMGHLWQALRDPDPAVRTMVVQSVAPTDQGIALLREALLDTDETVRSIAASSLNQGGSL